MPLALLAVACSQSDPAASQGEAGDAPSSPGSVAEDPVAEDPVAEGPVAALPVGPDDEEHVLLSAARYMLEMTRADEDYPYVWTRERGLTLPRVTSEFRSTGWARSFGHELAEAGWPAARDAVTDMIDRQEQAIPVPESASELGPHVYLVRECYDHADTRGYFDPTRPGFSPDGRWAVLVGWIGPDSYHGAAAVGIVLERTGTTWTPRARKFYFRM